MLLPPAGAAEPAAVVVEPAAPPDMPAAAVGGFEPAAGIALVAPAVVAGIPPLLLHAPAKSSVLVAIHRSNCRFMKTLFAFGRFESHERRARAELGRTVCAGI